MTDEQILDETQEEYQHPAIPHRRVKDTADLDITPMIDIVFLLLIFFLVSTTTDVQTAVDLPPARYGKGVSERNSVIITIAQGSDSRPAGVYRGDGTGGDAFSSDPKVQTEEIVAYVRKEDKPNVLVKAAKRVRHHEVSRVAAAAGQAGAAQLHLAVFEVQ